MSFLNEYINKRLSANELEKELLSLIADYNKKRGTFLIVYASGIGKPIPDIALSQEDYYIIVDMLREKINTHKKIDFYLETPGGSGEAAEEIVEFLRKHFDEVSFIVAGEAKSAGTLMVLSGDEIFMTETGSLGPIDAQIKIGRSIVSAYDYLEWINEKFEEAEKNGKLNPFDATMIAQISPGELKGVINSLKFAEDLVVEWLTKYKFKNWNVTESRKIKVTKKIKTERAKKIVEELIDHSKWRSHGRSIKIQDLENIGLKINHIDKMDNIKNIVYRIHTVCRLLFNSTTAYKIFATQDEKIFKQAIPINKSFNIKKSFSEASVVAFKQRCPQCGKIYKIYAKLENNPKIDVDFKRKGYIPFPRNNKIECECGFQIDLLGVRNEIEMRTLKKILD